MIPLLEAILISPLILTALTRQPPFSPRLVTTEQGMYRGLLLNPIYPNDAPSCHSCNKFEAVDPIRYSVDAYYGIQFASVLGSKLRFMPPTSSIEKWGGVRLAITHKPVCPQTRWSAYGGGNNYEGGGADDSYDDGGGGDNDDDEMEDGEKKMEEEARRKYFEEIKKLSNRRNTSLGEEMMTYGGRRERFMEGFVDRQNEECLFLNVFTPYDEGYVNSTHLLPVVVLVHGDSFDSGTGNAYDGSFLSGFGHVVVVTLNYRLGVLGFLSTEDANAQGNYALLDLIAALYWVRNNIKGFHGNKDSVTLVGARYGAALVNILMLSPVTRGQNLFHRSILLGGSALCPDCVINGDDARHSAFHHFQHLAAILNCSSRPEAASERYKSINKTPRRRDWNNNDSVGRKEQNENEKWKIWTKTAEAGRMRKSYARVDSTLQCIRQTPVEKILTASRQMLRRGSGSPFGPYIDRRKASILPHGVRSLMRDIVHSRHVGKRWNDWTSHLDDKFTPGNANRIRKKRKSRNAEWKTKKGRAAILNFKTGSSHVEEEWNNSNNNNNVMNDADTTGHPINATSWFATVPLMVGVDMWEGLKQARRADIQSGFSQALLNLKIKEVIDRKFNRHHQYLHDLVQHQYTDWSSTGPSTQEENLRTFLDVISDSHVTSSSVEVIRGHSEMGGRSYLFALDWKKSVDYSPDDDDDDDGGGDDDDGGGGGDDDDIVGNSDVIGALFPVQWWKPECQGRTTPSKASGLFHSTPTTTTRSTLAAMASSWREGGRSRRHSKIENDCSLFDVLCRVINFVTTGDPNNSTMPQCSIQQTWHKFGHKQEKYMAFVPGREAVMKQHLRSDKVALWSNLISKLQPHLDKDFPPSKQPPADHVTTKTTTTKLQQDDKISEPPTLKTSLGSLSAPLPKQSSNITKDQNSKIDRKTDFASPRKLEEKWTDQLPKKKNDLHNSNVLDLQTMQPPIIEFPPNNNTDLEPRLSTILSSTALWVVVLIIILSFFNLSILGCLCFQKWRKRMERKRQKRKYRSNGSLKLSDGMLASNEDAEDDETFSALRSYEVQQKERFQEYQDGGYTFDGTQFKSGPSKYINLLDTCSLDIRHDRPNRGDEVKYFCDILSTIERKENKQHGFFSNTLPPSERNNVKSVHFNDSPPLLCSSADRHPPKERIPIKLLPQRPLRWSEPAKQSDPAEAAKTIHQKCLIKLISDEDQSQTMPSSPSTVV